MYNQNGGLLLKKENIVDNDISNSTASYTPTKQEWESIFFSNTFYCYWYVEGYDSNNTTNNGSYRYISEEYDIILEKKYISVNTNNTSSGINGMSIDVDLYETYGNEINVRNFDVVIEYNWDTIPTERMQDYIVMRWSTVYQLNDQRYSVDYYNNDIETLRLSSTDFTYNVSSVGMNQIYWRTLLKYKTPENETPTSLYGEAHIGVTSTNSAASLMVTVSYHHTTSMAVGEKGVYMNESGIYTTDATQVETLTKIFTIA